MKNEMIYNLGLPKTGTTTLSGALNILGIVCAHDAQRSRNKNYQAYSGMLTNVYERYTEGKLIYTTRPLESWLESCKRHFSRDGNRAYRNILFGTYKYNQNKFIEAYEKWNSLVVPHVKKHGGILFNIWDGDGWEKLCNFLDKPVPKVAFPHQNKKR